MSVIGTKCDRCPSTWKVLRKVRSIPLMLKKDVAGVTAHIIRYVSSFAVVSVLKILKGSGFIETPGRHI